ncbi:serine/threonine-protein kinase-like protein CCR4 [Euphorbia lathyris]|uniref:serine/threonine-protein kinase-like protein CCR4 n=1 Tax=Euphorbia lathyris TaxID=212925 RepID=UPI003313E211
MASPLFNFLFLIFLSSSLSPALSLSTFAVSQTSNQTLICALNSVQNRLPFLNCSTSPPGFQIPGVNSTVSYSGLAAGNGFLCALTTSSSSSSSTSSLFCWRFSQNGTNMNYKRIYRGPILTQLISSNSQICGLGIRNRLQCWQWRDFNSTISPLTQNLNFSSIAVGEGFVCGLSESGEISCYGNNISSIIDNIPTGKFRKIAAGFRHVCALTDEFDLNCWGDMVGVKPEGKFKSIALGENRSCGLLLNNETIVCWGENSFRLPENLKDTFFLSIEAKRNVFCGVDILNFSLICWGNNNLNPMFQKVMPGPCQNACPCGILPGSGGFCSQGNVCSDCTPSGPPPPSSHSSPSSGSGKWSDKMIALVVVGCVGSSWFLAAIGFFLFKFCKFRGCRVHDSGRLDETGAPPEEGIRDEPQPERTEELAAPVLEKRLSQLASMGNAGHLEEFSLQVLIQATNNFSDDNKLGKGSFGSVYLGILEDGREVAIKRAETSSTSSYAVITRRQEDKDNAFINELESLSRLNHKNLVRLLGFCEECNELVLVYEYLSNRTLHDHLHKLQNSPLMSWAARIKVALDAARGIAYLHEYAVPPIIHRDIKSSNILLDESWTAKVSDFGLSQMGPEDEESHLSLFAAGTVGYMDPEYYRLQQLTTKSDVYSFGVVLLEMLSGCKAIHTNENGVPRNVVDFVVPYIIQDEIHRVLDSRVSPPTPFEIEAVVYVGYLATDCVSLEGRNRPSMLEVVNSLERALSACLVDPTSLSPSTTGSSA